jgi:outer membrane biosynthesis protein TonB
MPECAKINGIEGTVGVRCWITTERMVRGDLVLFTSNEIFHFPVLEAIFKWEFSPALKSVGSPTEITVAIPFRSKNN